MQGSFHHSQANGKCVPALLVGLMEPESGRRLIGIDFGASEEAVPVYRIVWRDPDHHITGMKDFEFASDAEAAQHARQFVNGHDIELYEHGRFVTWFRSTEHRD